MNGVTVANRITVEGDVDLFLGSNGSLRADEGITVNRGSSLVVSGTGKLYAGTTNGTSFSADDNNAGIGSENGARAVEKYNELKPDLVLMDITMPDATRQV